MTYRVKLRAASSASVITNFPFLVCGVLGFVLCVQGGFFNISLPGEVWGWALFYAGIVGLTFGSAYYHLKPDDSRVTWDTLPASISIHRSSEVWERAEEFSPERFDMEGPIPNETNTNFRFIPFSGGPRKCVGD